MKNRTYRYFEWKPLYPFGYGLSYTDFDVTEARAEGEKVKVSLRNTGKRAGDAVAQIYVRCDSSLAPVYPRLCGFRRVTLEAGEEKEIEIPLDPLTWTVVDENGDRQPVAHGILYVGLNQPDELSLELTGKKPIEIRF